MPDKLTDAQIENLRKSAYVHGTPPVFGDQITSALDELQTLRAENERLLPYAVALEERREAAEAESVTLRSHLRTCVVKLEQINIACNELSATEDMDEGDRRAWKAVARIAANALTPEIRAAAKEEEG